MAKMAKMANKQWPKWQIRKGENSKYGKQAMAQLAKMADKQWRKWDWLGVWMLLLHSLHHILVPSEYGILEHMHSNHCTVCLAAYPFQILKPHWGPFRSARVRG